jgi:transcriptional regulator with XRE-family HTH domain
MLALEGMMNAQRNRGMYLRVGERLAEIRKSRKISQAKLAKLLGVVEGTIQNYEHGRNEPNITRLYDAKRFKAAELDQAGIRGVVLPPPQGSERKVAPMTVSSPNVIEIKLDRLMDDMHFLRSQMIAFDRRLNGIEAYFKPSKPSEQQPESKSSPWFAAATNATARTVLFAVGAAAGAALLYLGT